MDSKTRQRKRTTSIKAILVRNFNWRMGQLRRLSYSIPILDPDLGREVNENIWEQMEREKARHANRLAFLEHGNPDLGGYDDIFVQAKFEAQTNKRLNDGSSILKAASDTPGG